MKFTAALGALLLASSSSLISAASTGRSKADVNDLTSQFFNDAHYEKIARQKNKHQHQDAGYQILPPKASPAQCNLALQRITQQPRTCAEQYLAQTARNVYLPIYRWFLDPVASALQFSSENGVSVEVSDAFNDILVETTAAGAVVPDKVFPVAANKLNFDRARTFALNYATFERDEASGLGKLQQIIYNDDGQLLMIQISVPLTNLPVIC